MNNSTIHKKIRNAVYAAIIGDAVGVPYEFIPPDEMPDEIIMKGKGVHNQPIGTWSDDSSMMLCIMKWLSIMHQKKRIFGNYSYEDYTELKRLWCDWYFKGYMTPFGKCFDIGNQTREALEESTLYNPTTMYPSSQGNGALMRILPFAFFVFSSSKLDGSDWSNKFLDVTEVMNNTSKITHGSIVSVKYCSLLLESLFNLSARPGELTWAKLLMDEELPKDYVPKSSGWVVDTYYAAIYSARKALDVKGSYADKYKNAIINAISLGNDTDTTAIITGGIMGMTLDKCLPDDWYNNIQNKELIDSVIDEFCNEYFSKG